jgi:hypothetical protein
VNVQFQNSSLIFLYTQNLHTEPEFEARDSIIKLDGLDHYVFRLKSRAVVLLDVAVKRVRERVLLDVPAILVTLDRRLRRLLGLVEFPLVVKRRPVANDVQCAHFAVCDVFCMKCFYP